MTPEQALLPIAAQHSASKSGSPQGFKKSLFAACIGGEIKLFAIA
jgi:hypothetical protein